MDTTWVLRILFKFSGLSWTDESTLTESHALQYPEVLNSYPHHCLKYFFAHSQVNTNLGAALLFAVRPRLVNEATRKHKS